MSAKANEKIFQDDMLAHLLANGWLLGKPERSIGTTPYGFFNWRWLSFSSAKNRFNDFELL